MQQTRESKFKELLPDFKTPDNIDDLNNLDDFRKGEKSANSLLKIAVGAGAVYGVFLAAPFILALLGKLIAILAMCGVLLVGWIAYPLFSRVVKNLVRYGHQAIIEHDPILVLKQRGEQLKGQHKLFRKAKNSIRAQMSKLKKSAHENEAAAKEAADKLNSFKIKAQKLQSSPQTHQVKVELQRLSGSVSREKMRFESANNRVQKYGVNLNTMTNLSRKIDFAEIAMNNKYEKFMIVVHDLEQDLALYKATDEATSIASSVLGDVQPFEVDHALAYIDKVVAYDIASTSSNIEDIMSYTEGNIDFDSDVVFKKLDLIDLNVNDASKYSDSTYVLSESDKSVSGFDLFE